MNDVLIKQITRSDLDLSAEIIRASFSTVARDFRFTKENAPTHTSFITTEKLHDHFESGWLMFGYYDDNQHIGYVSLSNEGDNVFELHNLAILPEYRHHGYGKQLVDFCKAKVKELGGKKITISIIEEHTVLRNWYERNGFTHIGTKVFAHLPFTAGYMEWKV